MKPEDLSAHRSSAVDAVTALVEHLTKLLLCCDLLDATGHHTAAREARRSLMRATTALHVLGDELVTIEIVEGYLRAQANERDRPPPS